MANNNITILKMPYILQDTFVYDGNIKTVQFGGLDSNTMTVSGAQSGRNVSRYSVMVSLKYPETYTWDDNSTSILEFYWSIKKAVEDNTAKKIVLVEQLGIVKDYIDSKTNLATIEEVQAMFK